MLDFALSQRAPQPTAVVRATIPVSEIPAFLGRAIGTVVHVLETQGIAAAGAPFAFYAHAPTATIDIEAGLPITGRCTPSADVVPSELPGGTIATVTHVGPYEAMMGTYNQLRAWVAEQGLALQEGMWEVYLSDPQREPDPSTWRTQISWPVAITPALGGGVGRAAGTFAPSTLATPASAAAR